MRHYGGHFVINWHHNLSFWKKVNLPCSNHLVPLIVFSMKSDLLHPETHDIAMSLVQHTVVNKWFLPVIQPLLKRLTWTIVMQLNTVYFDLVSKAEAPALKPCQLSEIHDTLLKDQLSIRDKKWHLQDNLYFKEQGNTSQHSLKGNSSRQ